jgi:multidrug efflux system membrane fusion protein
LLAQDSIAKQQVDAQESLVRQYEAALVADRGQVDSAKLQLTYTHITAPISGRTGLRQVDPGNIIHASDTTGVVVITQLQPITVIFSIPEDDLRRVLKEVRAGKVLDAQAYDRSGTTLLASGSLLTVDNQIDPTTGTVKLKAQFPNDDGALFPNQFVNVRLLVSTDKQVPVVSSAAIQHGTPGTYAFVVKGDNTVTIRPVKLGHAEGDRVAVQSGLEPGEVVVTDGTDKLREGSDVEIVSKDGDAVGAQGAKKHHDGNSGDPTRKGQHKRHRQE